MLESFTGGKFKYKKLTEEEQKNRGILGRLVGVIADPTTPTRNGRLYSKELWENVFNDPIMKEKIANRCCFGELNHPADREETDATKVAICLAEPPKFGEDGLLYGVFDILNTPNGKILKALCDYGCNIGVSSRGSGDVDEFSNEVDPSTYYCECFDAVILPAVKSARQKFVTESLHNNNKTLKQVLTEEYNAASDDGKKIMGETLDSLGIALEEDDEERYDGDYEVVLTGSTDQPEIEQDQILVEKVKEVADEVVEDDIVKDEVEDTESKDMYTIEDLQKELDSLDKKSEITFEPIIADDKNIIIKSMGFTADENGAVTISFDYDSEMSDNIDDEVEIADEAVEMSVDNIRELKDDADDNGEDETLESLKEAIRQKDLLENELKTLKNEKTVRDTEVNKLQEELSKYKSAFARTSELAAKAKKSNEEIKSLTEQLNQKDKEIESLKVSQKIKLTESVNKNAKTISELTESLNSVKAELAASQDKLVEQANAYKKKYNDTTTAAKKYINNLKTNYNTVITEYINFRASLLGIRPVDIVNRLNENYTLANINSVCDQLLTENVNMPRLNIGQSPRIKVNESKKSGSKYDDDLSDLYDLAGLL